MKSMQFVVALSLGCGAQLANAQSFPSKPVRLVAAAAGSPSTLAAESVAGPLGAIWKQSVLVENRPGPGNIPSAELVAKATPDGHTLLICSIATHGISPVLYKKLPYDHVKDFAPVSRLSTTTNVLVVHPSLPVKSVKEFVAYAKANPGKIKYGAVGVGASGHLTMELFRSMAGIGVEFVSLKQGSIINDEVIAGRLQAVFTNAGTTPALVKEGKLRAIAVSSPKPHPRWPNIPTVAESGVPGFEVVVWSGLCAPAATPKPVLAKLSTDVVKVMAMPETQKRFTDHGLDAGSSTPEEFAAFIKAENARWAKAAKEAKIELR